MIRASLPAQHVTDYGAGYPLTYLFDVPDTPGLVGQWSPNGTTWTTITPAPAGRFDGIEAARFSGTTAYLSVAFPPNSNRMWLRVSNGSTDVGTYRGIAHYYDDRVAGVIFTYDDWLTLSVPGRIERTLAGAALHRTAGLWMSGGFNGGMTQTWADAQATVDAGLLEPVNHGLNHRNGLAYGTFGGTAEEDALLDVVGGRDSILANVAMPPQSRGHVHGWIQPNGNTSATQRWALGQAKHLVDRGSENIAGKNYARWSPTDGLYEMGYPSLRTVYTDQTANLVEQQTQADNIVAAVTAARARREIAHLYSYIHHWTTAPGSPFEGMLQTVGALTDIWSVGWGHHALYRRTGEVIKIESVPAFRADTVDRSGPVVVTPAPGQVGDLLMAVRADTTPGTAQAIGGAGWTALGTTNGLAVWWKVATDSEPEASLSGSQTNQFAAGVVLRFAGVDTSDPIAGFAQSNNASAAVATAPAVTSGAGLVVRVWKTNNNPRLMPPPGATTRTLISTTSNELNVTIAEHATTGSPPAMTAPMFNAGTSQGATIVLRAGTEPPVDGMPSGRRGAVVAGFL